MMTKRSLSVFFVAAFIATAGCFGGDDDAPVDASSTDENRPASAAGVAAAVPSDGTSAPTTADGAAKVERVVAYAVDGKVPRRACLPAGASSCHGTPVDLGDGVSRFNTEFAPTAVNIEMTWEAEAPLTEELRILVLALKSCGNGCLAGDLIESVRGKSPLAYRASDIQLAEGEIIAFWVDTGNECIYHVVVFTCVSAIEQPFHIEGTLTILE